MIGGSVYVRLCMQPGQEVGGGGSLGGGGAAAAQG